MIELELLGIGADGETLVFTDPEGERYNVQITDELRGSIRRDRPRIEAAPDPARQTLRPRDIQALLRAGATPEEIAARHGLDIPSITRYEAPVQAEKDYALQRALASTIGPEADGPKMGDLVLDRLAARGVNPNSLQWSAQREANGPWQICLSFIQGAAEHGAHWLLPSSGVLEAVDREAQWLTETVSTTPAASIFTPLPPSGSSSTDHADLEEVRQREAIIDQLNAARGKRQDIEYELDEDEAAALAELGLEQPAPQPSSISARIYSLAQARTKEEPEDAARVSQASVDSQESPSGEIPLPFLNTESSTDATPREAASSSTQASSSSAPSKNTTSAWLTASIPSKRAEEAANGSGAGGEQEASLPGLESLPAKATEKKSKSRRRSVPSWDEIVFGAKPQ